MVLAVQDRVARLQVVEVGLQLLDLLGGLHLATDLLGLEPRAVRLATLEAQSVFDNKYLELLNQLNDLEGARRNLDANLRQVGSEDKATPIGIHHNIAIMNFQLNLLRRMIRGIDINENLNLHRLVAGSAIVKVLNPEDSKLLDQITSYSRSLDDKIEEMIDEGWCHSGFRVSTLGV